MFLLSFLYVFGSQCHDFFLGGVVRIHFAGEFSAGHDKDPVADTQQFRHFSGDHENRPALFGQVGDQFVYFIFCDQVDEAGVLIQQQDLLVCDQPAAEDDLLLVAT